MGWIHGQENSNFWISSNKEEEIALRKEKVRLFKLAVDSNIRKDISLDASVLGIRRKNSFVEIENYDSDKEWQKVKYGMMWGYTMTKNIIVIQN